jgi:hypothetical protein
VLASSTPAQLLLLLLLLLLALTDDFIVQATQGLFVSSAG